MSKSRAWIATKGDRVLHLGEADGWTVVQVVGPFDTTPPAAPHSSGKGHGYDDVDPADLPDCLDRYAQYCDCYPYAAHLMHQAARLLRAAPQGAVATPPAAGHSSGEGDARRFAATLRLEARHWVDQGRKYDALSKGLNRAADMIERLSAAPHGAVATPPAAGQEPTEWRGLRVLCGHCRGDIWIDTLKDGDETRCSRCGEWQSYAVVVHPGKASAHPADAQDAARYRWLRTRMTFHNIDADYDVEGANVPVLAQVSDRLWYHATDDTHSATLDDLIDAALAREQQEGRNG